MSHIRKLRELRQLYLLNLRRFTGLFLRLFRNILGVVLKACFAWLYGLNRFRCGAPQRIRDHIAGLRKLIEMIAFRVGDTGQLQGLLGSLPVRGIA